MMATRSNSLRDNLGEKRFEPLTREQEVALGERLIAARAKKRGAAEVRRIRDELIERHLRLVYAVASGYEHRMPADEAFAVGAAALTEAMDRWDPQPGAMSAYQWAKRWVTTALNKATDAERVIRLPEQVAYRAAGVSKVVRHAETRKGRKLTSGELEELTGGAPRLEDYPRVDVSLEAPLKSAYAGNAEPETLRDVLPTEIPGPEDIIEQGDLLRQLGDALDALSAEERMVLAHRFGLMGAEVLTLSQLGKRLGACGEAVRRLEATALAKLQHPANTNLTIGEAL